MFDSLRDTFQTVQEGISASFKGLSVNDTPRRPIVDNSNINYNAGADLLHKNQTNWSELHKQSEENAEKAQELDAIIAALHQNLENQWASVGHITATLATLPQLEASVQQLMEQLGVLQGLFEDVEGALFHLEDLVETQELQERQLDHRFQFALYKEKKLGELEAVRANLASEHAEKVIQHEVKQQKLLKERQETFGQAFQQDVEEFKLCGTLPKKPGASRGMSLEEVTLEVGDPEELDKFLNDDSITSKNQQDEPHTSE